MKVRDHIAEKLKKDPGFKDRYDLIQKKAQNYKNRHRVGLENVDKYLKVQLKELKFRRIYEFECLKLNIGVQVNQLKRESRLSYKRLAKKAHVSQKLLRDIEMGNKDDLTIETLLKIAKAFNADLKILFVRHSKNKRKNAVRKNQLEK